MMKKPGDVLSTSKESKYRAVISVLSLVVIALAATCLFTWRRVVWDVKYTGKTMTINSDGDAAKKTYLTVPIDGYFVSHPRSRAEIDTALIVENGGVFFGDSWVWIGATSKDSTFSLFRIVVP